MALKYSAVFLLFISQLLVSCNGISQKCKCGICDLTDKEEDNTFWQCQKEDGLDDELITSKLDSNNAVCLNYRVKKKGMCDFRNEIVDVALANPINDICQPSSKNPDRCCIHNHPEFAKNRCHRSQHYCAYKLQCPAGYYHLPIITALDLPKNDDGDCVDKVTITYESGKVITLCGSQEEIYEFNNKADRISPYPLIFKFQSSQCCHNCGFHIWLSCVPDPILGRHDTGFPYGYKLEEYKNPQNGFLYRKSSSDYHVIVPLGAKVIYKDYVVTIIKGERSLYQFTDISSIKVVDDLFGNMTFYGDIEDGLYGYGNLLIDDDKAMYENTRIPPELKPNYRDHKYIIDTAIFLAPFLVNSTYKSFVEPATKVPLPIIAGKLNRFKPECQETAEITMGYSSPDCKQPEYPSIRTITRVLAEASYLRKTSKNPFVLTMARDVIDLLHELTPVKLEPGFFE